MNKQIKKLAREAGLLTYNPDGQPTKLEKFADLIVQECADWIDGSPSTDAGQLVLTKSFIIANIKEHFGVEE